MRTFHARSAAFSIVLAVALGPLQSRIYDVTTAHAVIDARPVRPTAVFAPDDSPIYVWFRAEGCPIGMTIHSRWYYLGGDAPLLFADGTLLVDRNDDWGQVNFALAPGTRWSVGEYRVELRADGALLAETRFRIVNGMQSADGP